MSITDPYTDLFPALRQLLELVNRSSSIAPLPPPPHPPSVSEAAAREDFATIVRRVTTAELVSIRDKLRRGEVDGGIATACFFGHLARLRGSYYGGLQMDEDPYRPFERWLRRIGFGQTPTRGGAAATFENWLTEAIAAREGREEADEPVPEPLRRASGFYGFRVFSCDCPTCQERRAALQAVEGGRNQATFPRLEISEDGIITLEAGTARLVPAGSVARLEAALGEERRRRIIPADDLSFGDPSATAAVVVQFNPDGLPPVVAEAIVTAIAGLRLLCRGEAHAVDTPALDALMGEVQACDALTPAAASTLISVLEIIAQDADRLAEKQALEAL